MIDEKQLISKILASGLIDQGLLRQGLELAEQENTPLYETLILNELIDEQEVVAIASDMLNVPCVDLRLTTIDLETAHMIPAELAISSQTLPLELLQDGDVQVLRLAMTDPIDVMAMDDIASHTGVDIRPVLVGPADLKSAIADVYPDESDGPDPDESAIELLELAPDEIEEFEPNPELIEAPKGMVADEDSWAAMFEEPKAADSLTEDSSVVSQEMRDRPPTDVFEVVDEDLLDERFGSGIDFSPPPDMDDVDTGGTEIGSPAELGKWELDDALRSGAATLRSNPEDDEEADSSSPQLGTPVDPDEWDLDDGFYEDDGADDDDDDDDDVDTDFSNRTSIGLGMRGDLADLGIEVDEDLLEDSDSEEEPEADEEPEAVEEEPPSEEEPAADEEEEEESKKSTKKAVPKSIRDALDKVAKRKNKKQVKQNEKADEIPEDPPKNREKSETPLGRIAVKQVAVPAFKGAVEKRSDKKKSKEKQSEPVAPATTGKDAPITREMSTSDLVDLAMDSSDDKEEAAEGFQLPADVDSEQLLGALIELMISRGVLSREDIESMIEAME